MKLIGWFLFFSQSILPAFHLVNGLECRWCSSQEYDSPCRNGTEETTKTCDPDEGDDACYEEHIFFNIPLYRRGCASKNWCDIQVDNHGTHLKKCNTCQDNKCNNDNLSNRAPLECRWCSSDEFDSACRKGTNETTKICNPSMDEDACYEEKIFDERISARPLYRRGCAPKNWCDIQEDNHGFALKECKTCQGAKCNSDNLNSYDGTLECRRCSSTDYDGPCRTGIEENTITCDPNIGDNACYEEYLLGDSKYDKPLYRRGCAPKDWCEIQMGNHGDDLKYCRTCQGPKCNNATIGSRDRTTIMCQSCQTTRSDSCVSGTQSNVVVCPFGENSCISEYVVRIQGATAYTQEWMRGCGRSDFCTVHKPEGPDVYDYKCEVCAYDFCNNVKMKSI